MNEESKRRRLLVKVLQDVTRDGPFDTYADLFDAFKFRCARLHIRYTPTLLNAAINQLEHEGLLPVRTPPPPAPARNESPMVQITISREEAHVILDWLFAKVK